MHSLLFFLNMGVTFPILNKEGKVPCCMQLLYSVASIWDIKWAVLFSTMIGVSLAFPFSKLLMISTISSGSVSSRYIDFFTDFDIHYARDWVGREEGPP